MARLKERHWVPCRVCGVTHTNPRSSSICPVCGTEEAAKNKTEGEMEMLRAENEAYEYARIRERSFENADTVHELKEWIREYML